MCCCGAGVTAWHLKMKALCSFKMLETTHLTTQYHIPGDWNSQKHCFENFKCHKIFLPCETADGHTVAQVVTCWLLLCSVLSTFMWDSWWMERNKPFYQFSTFPIMFSFITAHLPLPLKMCNSPDQTVQYNTPVFQLGALCLMWHFADLSVRNS